MRRFLAFVLALVAAPAAVLGAGQAALAGHQDAATAAALAAACFAPLPSVPSDSRAARYTTSRLQKSRVLLNPVVCSVTVAYCRQ